MTIPASSSVSRWIWAARHRCCGPAGRLV